MASIAQGSAFPANKRHAMLPRRRSPSPGDMTTAQLPNPKVGHFSPGDVSTTSCQLPANLRMRPPTHASKRKSARDHLECSQSSEYFLGIKRSPGPSLSRSRKIDSSTIETDLAGKTGTFQSDAFAVQMPTTREPILNTSIFRAELPSSSGPQVEAYQTYKENAQCVHKRNNSEGVRVPSKIISHDYDFTTKPGQPTLMGLSLTPSSPPQPVAAGSYPTSPPVPQLRWTQQKEHYVRIQTTPPPSISQTSATPYVRQVGVPATYTTSRPHSYSRYYDADIRATRSTPSPPPLSTRVKVRVKPGAEPLEDSPPPKESWWGRTPPPLSTDTSRSSSPAKPVPDFAYTTRPMATDTVHGHNRTSSSNTSAASSSSLSSAARLKKENPQKRTFVSRLNWLRNSGARVTKPNTTIAATTTKAFPAKTSTTTQRRAAYIDPFLQHATPSPFCPVLPAPTVPKEPLIALRALPSAHARARVPFTTSSLSSFPTDQQKPIPNPEIGFAQVTSAATSLFKVCLAVYALVGVYFLLDAAREAVHVLGAPVRGVSWVLGWVWWGLVRVVQVLGDW